MVDLLTVSFFEISRSYIKSEHRYLHLADQKADVQKRLVHGLPI